MTFRDTLKNSYKRRCDIKFWLFQTPWYYDSNIENWNDNFISTIQDTYDFSSNIEPIVNIYPRWALVQPGESLRLRANESYARGGGGTLTYTWAVEAGSAAIGGSGSFCDVTPTGGEGSEVVIKCTVTDTTRSSTMYGFATIAASQNGWIWPSGRLRLTGSLGIDVTSDPGGWSGQLTCQGSFVDKLSSDPVNRIMLVHITTYYDEQEVTYDGRGDIRRSNNLCVLRVEGHSYRNQGRYGVTTLKLGPLHNAIDNYSHELYYDDPVPLYAGLAYAKSSVGALPTDVGGYVEINDFKSSDAIHEIAVHSPLNRYFNVDMVNESTEFDALFLAQNDGLWTMIGPSIAKSRLLKGFFDKRGTLRVIPQPGIREGDYYSGYSYIFPTTEPLTLDYCHNEPQIKWRDSEKVGAVRLGFYDGEGGYDVATRTASNRYGFRVEDKTGFLASNTEASNWTNDLLQHLRRDWDVTVKFFCPGNLFELAQQMYLYFESGQGGTQEPIGIGVVHTIEHDIDLDNGLQFTTVSMYEKENA